MNIHDPPLREFLAAEYVLGTLQGAARRRFERLLPAHPALQRAVVHWEHRLNRLIIASRPEPPPPQVWRNIERRLFAAAHHRTWWNSLILWRSLALAGVLATVIALTPHLELEPQEAAGMPFAAIRGKEQEVLWTVALAQDGRLHVNNLRAMDLPAGKSCMLWLKTDDRPPLMLGELPGDGSTHTLKMPADRPNLTQGKLWVTMQSAADASAPDHPLYQARWQAL